MEPAISLSPVQAEYRDALLSKLAAGEYRMEQASCLCGAADDVPLADCDRYGIPVGIVLCWACGLARTSPRLATDNLGSFYEHDYHGLHFGIRNPSPSTALFRRGQGAAIVKFLSDLLVPGPLRVADIGAGTGQVLREFEAAIDRRVEGVGCEYSAAFVEAGKRAGSDIHHGGPETLEGPFDLVILSHVVEHFPEPIKDLAAVRALGHDRTMFYVEVPGLLTIDRKAEYAYTLAQYLTLAHTFHFTNYTLADTMQRAGFLMIRGDEQVRSVFVQVPLWGPTRPELDHAERILASLAQLDSRAMQRKRLRPRLRQWVAAKAKSLLPEHAVRAIRSRR